MPREGGHPEDPALVFVRPRFWHCEERGFGVARLYVVLSPLAGFGSFAMTYGFLSWLG